MANETPNRSAGETDACDDAGEHRGEHSPLSARAAFLANWSWELVCDFNRRACARGGAQHGHASDGFERVRAGWERQQHAELTLPETLDFLRSCHRGALFLFFNGNTFAEIARCTVDLLLSDLPPVRAREAASLAAHHVAGVLDLEILLAFLTRLLEPPSFQPGARVRSFRGSLRGTVARLRPDGGAVLRTEDGAELLALPETLLPDHD